MDISPVRQPVPFKLRSFFLWVREHFVLSILLMLFLVPFLYEGWSFIRTSYLVNEAARQGARQAATGRYDNCLSADCSSSDEVAKNVAVDNARLASIHRIVYETLGETAAGGSSTGQTRVAVCSSHQGFYLDAEKNRCVPADHPGDPAGPVIVAVQKDYLLGSSLGGGVASVPIQAQSSAIVESFRMTRSISVPPTIIVSDGTTSTSATFTATDSSNIVDTSEQLVVVTGSLRLIANDVDTAAETITSIAKTNGGYVAQSTLKFDGNQKNFNIQIRVPADKFDAAFGQTKKLGSKVLGEDVSRKDVTEEYVDLEARLRSLQATSDRVKEFLEKAKTVNEALNVNVELGKIQEQIEQVTGRQKYLESQARFAAIDIVLSEKSLAKLNAKVTAVVSFLWNPAETIMKALKFLTGIVYFTGDILIWIVIVGLPVGLVLWVIGKMLHRPSKPKA